MKKPSLFKRQRGVTAIEYAILAAALALTLLTIAGNNGSLSKAINSAFEKVEDTITQDSK